jgi:hypothetical protein
MVLWLKDLVPFHNHEHSAVFRGFIETIFTPPTSHIDIDMAKSF